MKLTRICAALAIAATAMLGVGAGSAAAGTKWIDNSTHAGATWATRV